MREAFAEFAARLYAFKEKTPKIAGTFGVSTEELDQTEFSISLSALASARTAARRARLNVPSEM